MVSNDQVSHHSDVPPWPWVWNHHPLLLLRTDSPSLLLSTKRLDNDDANDNENNGYEDEDGDELIIYKGERIGRGKSWEKSWKRGRSWRRSNCHHPWQYEENFIKCGCTEVVWGDFRKPSHRIHSLSGLVSWLGFLKSLQVKNWNVTDCLFPPFSFAKEFFCSIFFCEGPAVFLEEATTAHISLSTGLHWLWYFLISVWKPTLIKTLNISCSMCGSPQADQLGDSQSLSVPDIPEDPPLSSQVSFLD